MSPQLRGYADAYRDARATLHSFVDGLTDEAFNWKPDAKRWSVGECIVHLNKIAKGYLPLFREAVEARAAVGEGPFTYGFVTRKFTDAVRPGSRPIPTGGGMKPPPAEGTRSAIDKARAVERFDTDIDAYLEVIEASEGLDLARIKVRSPFLPLLRLPLGGMLDAMGLHAIRHVQQAERVTRLDDFPA